jgi:hypothetical protein
MLARLRRKGLGLRCITAVRHKSILRLLRTRRRHSSHKSEFEIEEKRVAVDGVGVTRAIAEFERGSKADPSQDTDKQLYEDQTGNSVTITG